MVPEDLDRRWVMSIWEESTKYLAGNKQTKQNKRFTFPAWLALEYALGKGRWKECADVWNRTGESVGGVKMAALRGLAWCSDLQAPTISAPTSDNYSADVIHSPMATSLACGQLEVDTCSVRCCQL